jgi:hypothetical protein
MPGDSVAPQILMPRAAGHRLLSRSISGFVTRPSILTPDPNLLWTLYDSRKALDMLSFSGWTKYSRKVRSAVVM